MEWIEQLKQLAENLAQKSDDRDFETQHLDYVAHYAKQLSEKRGLSLGLCLAIAYGHDLGRLKEGIFGKPHAAAGARVMKKWLELNGPVDLCKEEKKLICRAIARHNLKDRCDGPYDEMIKDADSLAHHLEGIIHKQSEQWRVEMCQAKEVKLQVMPSIQWHAALLLEGQKLQQHLSHHALYMEKPDLWVHQTRLSIRKIRSIAWVYNQELKQRVKPIKDIANQLAKARFYHIALTMLPKNAPERHRLSRKLAREHKKNENNNNEHKTFINLADDFFKWKAKEDLVDCEGSLDAMCQKALETYLSTAKTADLEDQEAIHALRIQGKRLITWIDCGLVILSPEILSTTIHDLHHHIGKYRDSVLIRKYTHNKVLLSLEKEHAKNVAKALFYVQLISQSNY